MKKIKIMATTAMIVMVATAGYFGYTAYEYANMTDAERMMLANLEALTSSSEPGGSDYHGSGRCASGTSDVYKGMLYMVCGSCPTMRYLTDRTEGNCSW